MPVCAKCGRCVVACVWFMRESNDITEEEKDEEKPHLISAKWQIWDNTTHVKSSAVRILH